MAQNETKREEYSKTKGVMCPASYDEAATGDRKLHFRFALFLDNSAKDLLHDIHLKA